jgi:hypothetical protein
VRTEIEVENAIASALAALSLTSLLPTLLGTPFARPHHDYAPRWSGVETEPFMTSFTTTDHELIRRWAEERGAKPAAVKNTGGGDDVGIIRLDFPGYSGEGKLEEISWDEFFEKFEDSELALIVQETTADGERSNFNKLVRRDAGQ